ncbi:hypothetical protein EZV62_018900 [Acer yangbiense]|uniref:C3H1-type domain-containing protein n=1 Tax=Acer yangbiense TaxID=1000413 RepID=A0A5C7H9L9_9ROSI|nr:hypothetical protein EZV62_018900 [Acer yangbiense]
MADEEENETTRLSRKEKKKLAKKKKRKEKRKETAEKEREEAEDPEEQRKLETVLREAEEERERALKEFEERERLWIQAMGLKKEEEEEEEEEEEQRRKALEEEEEAKRQLQVCFFGFGWSYIFLYDFIWFFFSSVEKETGCDKDDDWEYVEEGPAEILWQGNEIIIKKKKVRVLKKDANQLTGKEDTDRPTSNPLPPQSEVFSDYKSAQQTLESVARQVPNFGTEQDKAHCPFHLKTGACRFGNSCSRVHFYPDKSCTLLIKNMYNGPGLAWEQDEGLEIYGFTSMEVHGIGLDRGPSEGYELFCIILAYTDEEVERSYEEFYEDVHTEFLKFGEIVNFKVCKNVSIHLRGNVYVHYKSLESAVLAYQSANGRYFAGKQVQCFKKRFEAPAPGRICPPHGDSALVRPHGSVSSKTPPPPLEAAIYAPNTPHLAASSVMRVDCISPLTSSSPSTSSLLSTTAAASVSGEGSWCSKCLWKLLRSPFLFFGFDEISFSMYLVVLLVELSSEADFFAERVARINCEFVNLTRWKVAICGEYMKSRFKSMKAFSLNAFLSHYKQTCSHGTACNFIHCFRNPGGDYEWADRDKPPPKFWVTKMVALFGYSDEYGYEKQVDQDNVGQRRNSNQFSADSDRHRSRGSRSREMDHVKGGSSRSRDDENDLRESTSSQRRDDDNKKRIKLLDEKLHKESTMFKDYYHSESRNDETDSDGSWSDRDRDKDKDRHHGHRRKSTQHRSRSSEKSADYENSKRRIHEDDSNGNRLDEDKDAQVNHAQTKKSLRYRETRELKDDNGDHENRTHDSYIDRQDRDEDGEREPSDLGKRSRDWSKVGYLDNHEESEKKIDDESSGDRSDRDADRDRDRHQSHKRKSSRHRSKVLKFREGHRVGKYRDRDTDSADDSDKERHHSRRRKRSQYRTKESELSDDQV